MNRTLNEMFFHFNFINTELFKHSNFMVHEFMPLVNSRVHLLANDKSNILNREFREEYQKFIKFLAEKPKPSSAEYLLLTYYLLL